jgi:DUF1680 family protein
MRLSLRVPEGCSNPTLSLDGSPLPARVVDGYLTIERTFKAGEQIELDLGFVPRTVVAHPRVESCRGAVAVERGPVVYCLEQADVPDDVEFHAVHIDPSRPIASRFEPELLGGVVSLELELDVLDTSAWRDRLYAPSEQRVVRRSTMRLVPYFAWANRGPGKMAVWLPVSGGPSRARNHE